MTASNLKAYDKIVKDLVCDFMEKFLGKECFEEFDYDKDIHFAGDDVGGVFDYNDYYINFSDAVLDLRFDMPKGAFEEWYNETIDRETNDEQVINYWSYCKGLRYKELDSLVLFREHRGSLADSLATQRNVRTLNDVFNIANSGLFYGRLSDLTCEWYANDDRMDEWKDTYIIRALIDDHNGEKSRIVLGFTNKKLSSYGY